MIVEASRRRGLEVECSVLGNEPEALETSRPASSSVNAEWYDYEAKYSAGGMDLIVPAPLARRAARRGSATLAAEIFALAGCAGLARCDFFAEPGGAVLVNEINTMPGFTETSVYAKLFEAGGLAYPELCDRWCGSAIERHRRPAPTSSRGLAAPYSISFTSRRSRPGSGPPGRRAGEALVNQIRK